MNQSMNDGGVCRTAPATPGLLKTESCNLESLIYYFLTWHGHRSLKFLKSKCIMLLQCPFLENITFFKTVHLDSLDFDQIF